MLKDLIPVCLLNYHSFDLCFLAPHLLQPSFHFQMLFHPLFFTFLFFWLIYFVTCLIGSGNFLVQDHISKVSYQYYQAISILITFTFIQFLHFHSHCFIHIMNHLIALSPFLPFQLQVFFLFVFLSFSFSLYFTT